MPDDQPQVARRDQIEKMAPAERLARSALMAAQGMLQAQNPPLATPNSLSDAVELLSQAREKLGDFYDQQPQGGEANVSADGPMRQETDPHYLRRFRQGG
jgi:hypothetical protein